MEPPDTEPIRAVIDYQRRLHERRLTADRTEIHVSERSDGTYLAVCMASSKEATGNSEAEAIGYLVLLVSENT